MLKRRLLFIPFLPVLAFLFFLQGYLFNQGASASFPAQASLTARVFLPLVMKPSAGLTPTIVPTPTKTATSTPPPGPTIYDVTDNQSSYANGQVPSYEKLEITFQITTAAQNLQQPYDPSPPPGLAPGQGITVDAIFESPSGKTSSQPAFYFQDFSFQSGINKTNQDWMYPTASTSWKVRFAPDEVGLWHYQLTAQDSSGTTHSSEHTYTVTSSMNHGFVRVSPNDSRYFQFEDGTYFPGLGYNMNFDLVSWDDPRSGNQSNFQAMGQNGIQLVRMWLSQWSIFGSQYKPWASVNGLDYGGMSTHTAPGSDFTMWLDAVKNPTMFWGWTKRPPAVKPNTKYHVLIKYLIPTPIHGPRIAGYSYGLVAKIGGWLLDIPQQYTDPCPVIPPSKWGMPKCQEVSEFKYASPVDSRGAPQWSSLQGSFTTGANQYFMDDFYLSLENVDNTGGTQALIDQVFVQEDLGNGQYGPNIISKWWMNQLEYFDQKYSFAFDQVLELAKQNGIYLRPVILEKTDELENYIDYNGNYVPYDSSNKYFYGNYRQVTKIRWLQQAWWRYLQARWGYSTNIQSWELLNEGDPVCNGSYIYGCLHATLADEFGKYMHQFKPNDHLVSTSNWLYFPVNFWNICANCDFADVHQYIPKDNDLVHYQDTAKSTFDLSLAYGAKQPGGIGKPVIRGETGLTLTSTEPPSTETLSDTLGIWLHNYVWGQINPGGLLESYWYSNYEPVGQIYTKTFDHRNEYGNFYRFISTVPLNNGNYQDAQAVASDANLRVWGQKDLVNGRAHLWIANKDHTWFNLVQGVNISPVTGTVAISGFAPNTQYPGQWFNTYTGATSSQAVKSDATGKITLSIQNLSDDLAIKIGN